MTRGKRFLLGDIGGTNLRFTLAAQGKCSPITTLHRADYGGLGDAIAAYLDASDSPPPDKAVLAIAGPLQNDHVVMTNTGWPVDARQLQDRLKISSVHLVNDFVATAWSLPSLSAADIHQINGARADPGGVKVVCGPGTGLGVSAFVPDERGGGTVISSEAGHITLAAQNAEEDSVLAQLRTWFGHVSAERALSGPGLENLHRALATVSHQDVAAHTAVGIVAAAREKNCDLCVRTVSLFCQLLGGFAGDMALAFGARGGIFLAGGILPHMVDLLEASAFRERFETKGRLREYLAPLPVYAILHPEPAILGLQAMIAAEAL
ncbi:glucokinase [Ferrovibrio sp.]|uniref:glucokinase n=1 Tax=Ferrovibrio sp. TaxID=1917215 RepID=UPI0035B07B2B